MWALASSFMKFLDHTLRRTTVGRTPLDGWSVRSSDLATCTKQHTTLTRDRYPCPPPRGILIHNLSRRAAADLRLWPRGQWDLLHQFIWRLIIVQSSGSLYSLVKTESTAVYWPDKTQLLVDTKFLFLSINKYLYKVCRNIYDRRTQQFRYHSRLVVRYHQ